MPRSWSQKKYHGRACKSCGGTERYSANYNCVPCSTRRAMASRAKNPARWNAYAEAARHAKLGLTTPIPPKTGECEICKRADSGRGLALDHEHSTGACRGWLCHNCNLGLGNFKDSPELLRASIACLSRI